MDMIIKTYAYGILIFSLLFASVASSIKCSGLIVNKPISTSFGIMKNMAGNK